MWMVEFLTTFRSTSRKEKPSQCHHLVVKVISVHETLHQMMFTLN